MYEEVRNKVFFTAGDVVKLKHKLDNRPEMLVQSIDKITMRGSDKGSLLGVSCIWFSTDLKLQSHRFNTKDLIKI